MSLFNIGRGVMSTKKKKWCLEFDGVDDYCQAQNNTDLDFALPIKVDLETDSFSGDYRPVLGKFILGAGNDRYFIIKPPDATFGYGGVRVQGGSNTVVRTSISNIDLYQRYQMEWDEDGADTIMKIDGVEVERETTQAIPNPTTDYYFTLGRAYSGQTQWHFEGKIYSFQIGTETFPMNEGNGTTTTGSEGTVLDIYGATWGYTY